MSFSLFLYNFLMASLITLAVQKIVFSFSVDAIWYIILWCGSSGCKVRAKMSIHEFAHYRRFGRNKKRRQCLFFSTVGCRESTVGGVRQTNYLLGVALLRDLLSCLQSKVYPKVMVRSDWGECQRYCSPSIGNRPKRNKHPGHSLHTYVTLQ